MRFPPGGFSPRCGVQELRGAAAERGGGGAAEDLHGGRAEGQRRRGLGMVSGWLKREEKLFLLFQGLCSLLDIILVSSCEEVVGGKSSEVSFIKGGILSHG